MLKRALACVAIMLFLASPASAGSLVLHPSGFGEHSYSAWKGGEGLPDSTGGKDQALYFQKMTSTATVAAGVAVFKGFEGAPTSVLGDLSFYWRTDGWCGAGAPRFNVRVQNDISGARHTIFLGCAGMVPGAVATDNGGRVWQQRTIPAGVLPPGHSVVSLAIVFDEGNELLGFTYLDNIRAGGHTWTSASDNGNGNTSDTSSVPLTELLGAPLESLFE